MNPLHALALLTALELFPPGGQLSSVPKCGMPLPANLPLLWTNATPGDVISGTATYYSPGLMESVARSRGYSLEGTAGGVAMNRRGDLGRLVWLERFDPAANRMQTTGPYRVVDCARQGRDYAARERSGRVVEVSFELATEWAIAGVGPTPIRVWLVDPSEASPGAQAERTVGDSGPRSSRIPQPQVPHAPGGQDPNKEAF